MYTKLSDFSIWHEIVKYYESGCLKEVVFAKIISIMAKPQFYFYLNNIQRFAIYSKTLIVVSDNHMALPCTYLSKESPQCVLQCKC